MMRVLIGMFTAVMFYYALAIPFIMYALFTGSPSPGSFWWWTISLALAVGAALTVDNFLLPNRYSFKLVRMYNVG